MRNHRWNGINGDERNSPQSKWIISQWPNGSEAFAGAIPGRIAIRIGYQSPPSEGFWEGYRSHARRRNSN